LKRSYGALGACLALICIVISGAAFASDEAKRILILFETESSLPAAVIIGTAAPDIPASKIASEVIVYDEFLDLDRFPEAAHRSRMAAFLREKYAKVPIDIVIAAGSRALDFMLDHRAELFKGASLTFVAAGAGAPAERHPPPDVVGIVMHTYLAPTVDLALRLQPNARQLVVVSGASYQDRVWEATARRELRAYQDRLKPVFLSALPMDQLIHEVKQLPRDAIVLYLTIYEDGAGKFFHPRDAAKLLADASSAPVFGIYDTYLESGVVGGHMDNFAAMSREVGRLAAHFLTTDSPGAEKLGGSDASADYVNWRQLQRWGIDDSLVPPGTIVKFRQPSLWTEYRWQIIIVLGLVGIQSLLLIALLIQAGRRRRAEQAMRESEARMALAADSARLGFWYWDRTTRAFWATKVGEQLLGFAEGEALSFEQVLARTHSEDQAITQQAFEQALDGSEPLQIEFRLLQPDGECRWISAAGRAGFAEPGKKARVMGVVADITERRRAEAEAADQREQLAHATRAAMLGELSGALTHELSQPLTAILSNAQAAQRLLGRERPDLAELRSIIGDIASEDMRAGEVIRHLRSLFKKAEIHYEAVNLNSVITEVQKIVRSELVARNVKLITRLSPDLVPVEGDQVQLQQVFLNLLVNAFDALQENRREDRVLMVATRAREEGGAEVAVVDNGGGISPQVMERLFQPFVTSKRQGLGLGLSVCRSIIRAHGGILSAVNNPERGATFRVALPLAAGAGR
jgi:PAS domain S-box-containing protein